MMSILVVCSLIIMKCERCEKPSCSVKYVNGAWLCLDCRKGKHYILVPTVQ